MKDSLQDNVIFERLNAEHSKELVTLEQACFSMPWGQEQYEAAFSQNFFLAYGLRQKQTKAALIGYVSLYHMFDEVEILNIAVKPEFRRCGLGEYALRHVLFEATQAQAKNAVLEVRMGNSPARKLYEKIGFSCVGTRKKYYADTGEDACIYTLAL